MLEHVYEGLNARSQVYLSKEYFCKMYTTCVTLKLCEFIRKLKNSQKLKVCEAGTKMCFCKEIFENMINFEYLIAVYHT